MSRVKQLCRQTYFVASVEHYNSLEVTNQEQTNLFRQLFVDIVPLYNSFIQANKSCNGTVIVQIRMLQNLSKEMTGKVGTKLCRGLRRVQNVAFNVQRQRFHKKKLIGKLQTIKICGHGKLIHLIIDNFKINRKVHLHNYKI